MQPLLFSPRNSGTAKSRPRELCPLALLLLLIYSLACSGQQQPSQSLSGLPLVENLIRQGGLDEARRVLLDDLSEHPANVNGYNLLGILDVQQKDFPGAHEAFLKALSLDPNSTRTHNNLGDLYAAEAKLDLAEKEYRTALRLDPRNRDGNYNLGLLLMSKGSPSSAIAFLQQAGAEDPNAAIQLVDAYLKSKRIAEALQAAARISDQHKSDVQLHISLGVLLATAKQFKSAQIELEKADALQPDNFEVLYNLGLIFYRSGNIERAAVTLGKATTLRPDSLEALYMLAEVYEAQSHPLDALDLLVRARRIAPRNIDILYRMARIGMSQSYFEDAEPVLESALQIAPSRADLRASLGECYFMAGKVDRAIAEFKQLLEVENSAQANAYLGLAYTRLGRFDDAKIAFRNGLKLDPKNILCLYNLGFIAERQGQTSSAAVLFDHVLQLNPKYPWALLELANLRAASGQLKAAELLLRRYILVSPAPAPGYYKLAKVERTLHEDAASERDLKLFQTLSKNVASGSYPYENLFDYLNSRSTLEPAAREQLDLTELANEAARHPDQPQGLYLLAEAYLKSGKVMEARDTLAQLDSMSAGDYRTLTGVGVLLARHHLYVEASEYFEKALQINPKSDEVRFDLANAFFRMRRYTEALNAAEQLSPAGRKDDSYLSLLGDIHAHLGNLSTAEDIFRNAIIRNPDDDQNYLSLSLLQLREGHPQEATKTLSQGQARIPASGKILWAMGLADALDGRTLDATLRLERAVDLLPDWSGGYSLLGVLYFETGHLDKAKEVLGRFRSSSASGSLDADKIESFLSQASAITGTTEIALSSEKKEQFLQLALSLADRTL